MKLLSLILLSLLSIATHAITKTIECKSFYEVEWDMPVSIKIRTDVKKTVSTSYEFTNRSFEFLADPERGQTWYDFRGKTKESVTNYLAYRPRKYKGHLSVNIASNMPGFESGEEAPYGFYGNVDFLIPKDLLNKTKVGDTFESVTILTSISDHWGGSRTLNCEVIK